MQRRRLLTVLIAPLLAALAATTPAAAATGPNYVALGDSYSSGLGAGNYDPASGSCYRSTNAYPKLWASSHNVSSFQFAACSGATTQDVLNSQLPALSTKTNKVTITIGGNDAGFASVATTCTTGSDTDCYNAVSAAKTYINNQLPGRLDTTYSAIHQRSPLAQVVVVSYPRLFDMTWWCYLGSDRRTWLNEGADLLASVTNARTNAAAARFGANSFRFADSRSAFDAHGVCSSDAWLNGVSWPVNESYHPNAAGQAQGFLPTVRAVTG